MQIVLTDSLYKVDFIEFYISFKKNKALHVCRHDPVCYAHSPATRYDCRNTPLNQVRRLSSIYNKKPNIAGQEARYIWAQGRNLSFLISSLKDAPGFLSMWDLKPCWRLTGITKDEQPTAGYRFNSSVEQSVFVSRGWTLIPQHEFGARTASYHSSPRPFLFTSFPPPAPCPCQ